MDVGKKVSLGVPIETDDVIGWDESALLWQGIYCGSDGTTNVRHVIKTHSPTGLNWGYGGSGPADMARNALEQVLGACGWDNAGQVAAQYYQDFKRACIANIPRDRDAFIRAGDIIAWVRSRMRKEDHDDLQVLKEVAAKADPLVVTNATHDVMNGHHATEVTNGSISFRVMWHDKTTSETAIAAFEEMASRVRRYGLKAALALNLEATPESQ